MCAILWDVAAFMSGFQVELVYCASARYIGTFIFTCIVKLIKGACRWNFYTWMALCWIGFIFCARGAYTFTAMICFIVVLIDGTHTWFIHTSIVICIKILIIAAHIGQSFTLPSCAIVKLSFSTSIGNIKATEIALDIPLISGTRTSNLYATLWSFVIYLTLIA